MSIAKAREMVGTHDSSGSPTHMQGYEALGTEDSDTAPLVRKLGVVTFTKGGEIHIKEESQAEMWPEEEVYGGVSYVDITTYGDCPRGAFIKVCGPDRQAVEDAWHRARTAWIAVRDAIWDGPVGTGE